MGKTIKAVLAFGLIGVMMLLVGCSGGDVSADASVYKKTFTTNSGFRNDTKEDERNTTIEYDNDTGNIISEKVIYWSGRGGNDDNGTIIEYNTTYSYNENNILIKVNSESSGDDYKWESRYQNDSVGNLVEVKSYIIYPNGDENLSGKRAYEYNDDHNITAYKEWNRFDENNTLEEAPTVVKTYTYNETKQLSKYEKTYHSQNGKESIEIRKYEYDKDHRIDTIAIEDNSHTAEEYFRYTDKGRLDKIVGISNYRDSSHSFEQDYIYNKEEQISKIIFKANSEITRKISYTYDENGNIEKKEIIQYRPNSTSKYITINKWKQIKKGNPIPSLPKIQPYLP